MATRLNNSVEKAFRIIEIICTENEAVTLREIAIKAKMPVATTHRIINTLRTLDIVRKGKDGHLVLGSKVTSIISNLAVELQSIQDSVDHTLSSIVEWPKVSARLSTYENSALLILAGKDSGVDERFRSRVGNLYEAYCTAPGKVMLSSLDGESLLRYFNACPVVRMTQNTIVNFSQLYKEMQSIRLSGYALDNEEYLEGVKCIAVPLKDEKGVTVATLSVASEEFSSMAVERVVDSLIGESARLQQNVSVDLLKIALLEAPRIAS